MQGLIFIAVTAAGLFVACLNSSIFLAYGVYCAHGERTAPIEKPLARIALAFIAYGGVAGMGLAALFITGAMRPNLLPFLLGVLALPPSWVAGVALKRMTQSGRMMLAAMLGGTFATLILSAGAMRFDARMLFIVMLIASVAWHTCVAAALVRWSRHTRAHGARFCLHCGYSLEGLGAPICPECGEHITMSQPSA